MELTSCSCSMRGFVLPPAATNVMDRVRVYGGYLMPYEVVLPPPERSREESNCGRREEESNNNTQVIKSSKV